MNYDFPCFALNRNSLTCIPVKRFAMLFQCAEHRWNLTGSTEKCLQNPGHLPEIRWVYIRTDHLSDFTFGISRVADITKSEGRNIGFIHT